MAVLTIADLQKARKLAKRRKFQGLDISVETAKGGYRHWHDPHSGEHGRTKMPYDYGYIRGSVGADGEHVDCYVGDDESATHAYVVDQRKKPLFTEFDEQKVMLGFPDEEAARLAYLSCYNDPRFFGGIRIIPMEDFKRQVLATSDHQPLVLSEQHNQHNQRESDKSHRPRLIIGSALRKGSGPYIGPRGGKWADSKHTIPWSDHGDRAKLLGSHNLKARWGVGEKLGHGGFATVFHAGDTHVAKVTQSKTDGAALMKIGFAQQAGESVPEGLPRVKHTRLLTSTKHATHTGALVERLAGYEQMSDREKLYTEIALDLDDGRDAKSVEQYLSRFEKRVPEANRAQAAKTISVWAKQLSEAKAWLRKHVGEHAASDPSPDNIGLRKEGGKLTAVWLDMGRGGTQDEQHADYQTHVKKAEQSLLLKAGPYIGPRGGKWADAKHTIPWEGQHAKVLFHSAPAHSMESIQEHGLGLDFYGNEDDPMARTLLLPGQNPAIGQESGKAKESGIAKHVSPHGSTRYLHYHEGKPVAGLQVVSKDGKVAKIANVYTHPDHRRKGLADKLLERAKKDFGQVEHADEEHRSADAKAWKKSERPVLLFKANRPPPGYQVIPHGTKGGYRKRVGKGWTYWYPSAGEDRTPAEYGEEDFAAGRFDRTPGHWHFIRAGAGRADIHAWTVGGIDPASKHPVKIGGQIGRLYQVTDPEPKEHPGWALLRDVNSGETSLVKHSLIYPVEHSREGKKAVAPPAKPGGTKAPGTPGRKGPTTGWVAGSDSRIQAYTESTAKKGSMLYRVESGEYPRKQRRSFREDADGTPRQHTDEVLAMPDADKVKLLSEMQGLVRRAADRARRKFAVAKTAAVMEDLHSASMEGLLHAIDNYRGGYSFVQSALSYAEQYARLHAAREFAGGVGMRKREARLLPGFMAARAEANRSFAAQGGNGDAPTRFIAEHWKLHKRDRHAGLTEGADALIPLGDYSLRAGEIVTGKDKPGRLKLAQAYVEFLDGQKGHVDITEDEGAGAPLFPGAGVGYGLGATAQLEASHDLNVALQSVEKFDAVIGQKIYRLNAADLLRRRLGLGMEPQSQRAIADSVPIYRFARSGDLKQISPRTAFDVIDTVVEQAMDHMRDSLSGDTAGMVEQAKQRLAAPVPIAHDGPTVYERIEADSRKVTNEDVRAWRAGEREKLRKLESHYEHNGDHYRAAWARTARERLKGLGRRAAARHIAEMRVLMEPRSREWFRSAIPTPIEVLDPRNEYGHATMTLTDLATGKQRRIRIRTIKDLTSGDEAYKSEAASGTVPDTGVLRLIAMFPRLAQMLWGSDDPLALVPTMERAAVLEAMGF